MDQVRTISSDSSICLRGVRYIDIVDSRTGDSYECDVHTLERNHCIEKFLGRGWNKFVKNKGLSNKDHVGLSI
ncbi:hypothetical protein RYX36_014945, partial [Vicia faba]